jgi:hypothetical protein
LEEIRSDIDGIKKAIEEDRRPHLWTDEQLRPVSIDDTTSGDGPMRK